MITHTREFITPDIAQEYLNTSIGNRKLRPILVKSYADQIKQGKFKETHQGIAFDENGRLMDGHHRLSAIVIAGMGIWIDVARGVSRNDVIDVDTGSKRTFDEALVFSGKYSDKPSYISKTVISSVRTLIAYEVPLFKGHQVPYEDLLLFMAAIDPEIESLYKATDQKLNANIGGAALAALLSGEKPENLKLFFDVFNKGNPSDDTKNNTIVFNWRNAILAARAKRNPFSKSALYSGTQWAIYHFCRGDNVKIIRPMASGAYKVRDQLIKIVQGL